MATMRAAFCPQPGRLELRDVARPTPATGEVLVRVRSCGICGSDLHFYQGGMPCPAACPGHEISGEVAELGPGVESVHPGDRVVVQPLVVCRRCPACLVGDYQLCRTFQVIGLQTDGGFADFVRVPAYGLFSLPDEFDWAIGALAEPTAVCVHAVRLGDRVLVPGAGAIGLLAALAARAAGAADVLITARHPHQRQAAARLGARPFAGGADRELSTYALAHPIDVVIETVGGSADTLNEALFAVRPGGAVSVLGVFTAPVVINALILMAKEVRLIGSMTYGRTGARADFDDALDLLQRYREQVTSLVTHRFPLVDVGDAFAVAADKRQGSIKVSIQP